MDAEVQLAGFIDKFEPGVAERTRQVLAAMRERLPGAVIPVYDNYNALAIGFGPTDRLKDIIFSIAVYPRWVSLFFNYGVGLPDPEGLLKGGGGQVRHIVLADGAATLEQPGVRALVEAALEKAGRPLDTAKPQQLIIKSVSARQRPRRPGSSV
jgi:hypothetical protein